MTGTIASILRAPALEWPDELAREANHHTGPTMPDTITVTLTRAEADALLSTRAPLTHASDHESPGRTLEREDARAAYAKLERALLGRAA